MTRYRKRGRPAQPRVDDLFYDNPAVVDPAEGEATREDAAAGDHGDPRGAGPGAQGSSGATAVGAETALARRGNQRGAAGRWARALLVAGVAGGLVYGAGSGQLGAVDLAAALDRPQAPALATGQQAGQSLITQASLGCVGPGQIGLDDASVAETEQEITAYAASAPAQALADNAGAQEPPIGTLSLAAVDQTQDQEVTERAAVARIKLTSATWARVSASGPIAAGVSASQASVSVEEQQRGLTTAACWPALDDTWLVAGGGEPGRAERLLLVNPTGNPITADVEVFGAQGQVEVVGGRGIVVGAGERQVVLLDALAPGEERPVLHVRTTGGPVIAALADRWLEGTLDRGLELTTPTSAPATNLLVPAVPAPRAESADSASLRVAVPGTEEAVVQVRALTVDGPVRVDHDVTNVAAGAVTDIGLSDLPEGTHGIEVVADTPVVAAAHVERRDEEGAVGDLAWIPAIVPTSELVGGPLVYPGSKNVDRELTLASLDGGLVEVTTVTESGVQVESLQVPAASSVSLPVDPEGTSLWVRTLEGSTSAAVISELEYDLGVLIAGMPLPDAPVSRSVRAVAPWLP